MSFRKDGVVSRRRRRGEQILTLTLNPFKWTMLPGWRSPALSIATYLPRPSLLTHPPPCPSRSSPSQWCLPLRPLCPRPPPQLSARWQRSASRHPEKTPTCCQTSRHCTSASSSRLRWWQSPHHCLSPMAPNQPSNSSPTRAPSSQIPSMHFSLSMDLLQPNPVLRSEAARLMTTVIWTARRDLEGESRREAVIYHKVNHCLKRNHVKTFIVGFTAARLYYVWELTIKDHMTCVYRAGTREVHNKLEKNR